MPLRRPLRPLNSDPRSLEPLPPLDPDLLDAPEEEVTWERVVIGLAMLVLPPLVTVCMIGILPVYILYRWLREKLRRGD